MVKQGTLIQSRPIIVVGASALILIRKDKSELPIPYDKRSRNRLQDRLAAIAKNRDLCGRVRLSMRDEGFVEIDIRAKK